MRVLVLGGGGREHAIVNALLRSPSGPEVMAAPGNPGIAAVAECLPDLDPVDVPAVVGAAQEHGVDLVVVGPEAPLVAGGSRRAGGPKARASGMAATRTPITAIPMMAIT